MDDLCHCSGRVCPITHWTTILYRRLLGLSAILILGSADAPAAELCPSSEEIDIPRPQGSALETGQTKIVADRADFSRVGQSTFSGDVNLYKFDLTVTADEASYDNETEIFSIKGNIRVQEPSVIITGDEAELSGADNTVRLDGAEIEIPAVPSRGSAGSLETLPDGRLQMEDVTYTTCPQGGDDWILRAGELELDQNTGKAIGRKVKLDFYGVPIFYTPYISFSTNRERKSGFLTPEFGSSSRLGTEISVPYYFNLAPNYDETLSAHYLSDSGIQFNSLTRYLTEGSHGELELEYLNDDDQTDNNRAYGRLDHQTQFQNGWRVTTSLQDVSDSEYFEDFGRSLSITSQTHLKRNIDLEYQGQHWAVLARTQNFRTLDKRIDEFDRPYEKLPQLYASGRWPNLLYGLDAEFDSEAVSFDRDEGVTGYRLDLQPGIAVHLGTPAYFATPRITWEHTRYMLDDTLPGENDSPTRTLPIFSIDSGLAFERTIGTSEQWIQTLEPRLFYAHIPYRNQDDIPVFDTGDPDVNLVQLFRANRFAGVDRVGDTDQLSLGISTRLFSPDTGRQILSATLGQAFFLSDESVSLPGEPVRDANKSEYIAELDLDLYRSWTLDFGLQWDPDQDETAKSEIKVLYRPESEKILNIGYRFRRDDLEQGNLGFSYPVGRRWTALGNINYSLRDKTTLERLVGIKYETCCWAIRMASRRHISRRTGQSDTSFSLQLELKGFASVGKRTEELLEEGILGDHYR